MNSRSLIATFAVLATSTSALADQMLPYIAPANCSITPTVPANSGGVLFSRNCEYGFVLPSVTGRSQMTAYQPSMNLLMCPAVNGTFEAITNYGKIQLANSVKIASLFDKNPNDPVIQTLRAANLQLSSDIQTLAAQYRGLYGGTVAVALDGSTTEAELNDWRSLNHQMTESDQRTKFVRAPIAEGYISFNEVTKSAELMKLDPPILASSIPGLKNPNVSVSSNVMNGGIEGSADLALSTACALIKDKNYDPNTAQIDEARAAKQLIANFTYSVPVQTGVSFEAKLDVNNAIKAISAHEHTEGQFTANDILRSDIGGSSTQTCSVNITRYETPVTTDVSGFERNFTGTICTTLLSRLTDRLVTKGFLTTIDREAGSAAAAKAGGNSAQTYYRRECFNKKFLGVTYDSGCNDVPYQVLSWHDGLSSKDVYVDDEAKYFESESADVQTVLYRWRTMNFSSATPK